MGLLSDFRLSVIEKNLGVYGIHVYQNGKTLAEHRFRSNERENLYSASKTRIFCAQCGAIFSRIYRMKRLALDGVYKFLTNNRNMSLQ